MSGAIHLRTSPPSYCWYCGKHLTKTFTSVASRDGIALRVHYGCRVEAAEFQGRGIAAKRLTSKLANLIGQAHASAA